MFNLFRRTPVDKNSYYYRYIKQAHRFESLGVAAMVISIVTNELTGRSFSAPVIVFAAIGVLLLIIGGSSAQPHVVVKSFSSLLRNDPSTENAREFLTALNAVGNVSLTQTSINLLYAAVEVYAHDAKADPDLAKTLEETVDAHIKKKLF